MQLYRILFTAILLIGICRPCEGLFSGTSLQDFVESFIDAGKFKLNGIKSLNASAIGDIWSFFKTKFGRHYSSSDEENQRIGIFHNHLKYVLESNFGKLRTFQLELNEFADWTLEEFNSLKKGLIVSTSLRRDMTDDEDDEESFRRSLTKLYRDHYHSRRLKRNIHSRRNQNRRFFSDWFSNFFDKNKNNQTTLLDWRAQNVVTSIKNQRKCGSCYAFATAAVMESLYAIKTKSQNPTDFSPQQLIDCSSNGNNGCSGGNFPPSVRFLLGQGSKIATLDSYPYAEKKQTCKTSGINQINLGNIEYSALPEGDEQKLADALANSGPLFIGLDADSKLFMFYKAGVLKIDNCPKRRQDMDHAMVLVGYGYDNNLKTPYWIIKNSWGTGWGEKGYLRLAKDAGNMCGITSMAYSAKLT